MPSKERKQPRPSHESIIVEDEFIDANLHIARAFGLKELPPESRIRAHKAGDFWKFEILIPAKVFDTIQVDSLDFMEGVIK